jgi:hypothetical protein
MGSDCNRLVASSGSAAATALIRGKPDTAPAAEPKAWQAAPELENP